MVRAVFGLLSVVIVLGLVAYLAIQPAKSGLLKPAQPASAGATPTARTQAEQQAKEAMNAAIRQSAERASQATQ
jgi:anionic cell wall polymer biosynthesis LytR-Cps2A-Psr (LCP) family protein